jgi:D-glycero-alpha-D-manno-heptose-7-phosphate kinase
MIITRTPLRISIGGGGTDLPSYYKEFGGFVISAAINKYVYININRSFFPGFFLKYSETEHAETVDAIKHRIIREALTVFPVNDPLEIVSIADVPGGTGLGSSGTFTVGLIHALLAHKRALVDAELLASSAVHIEMERLGEPVGKQDQYIAAYGGLLVQEYNADGTVKVHPLAISDDALYELRDSLMLFFVGTTRSASNILQDQKNRSEQRDRAMIESLHFTKQLGREIGSVLVAGDIPRFGELMHEHWLRKRQRSSGMSSDRIDDLYELARSRGGATGGKLVGAGGSGFLLFHTKDRSRLRRTMSEAGLREMDFSFDFEGSVVQLRNRG